MPEKSVILIEDYEAFSKVISSVLYPAELQVATTLAEARKLLAEVEAPDAVILDLGLPDSEADQTLEAIPELKALAPRATWIVITGMLDITVPIGLVHVVLRKGEEAMAGRLREAIGM